MKQRLTTNTNMKRFALTMMLMLSGSLLSAQIQMVRLTRFEGTRLTGVSVNQPFEVEIYQSENTRAEVEIPTALENDLEYRLAEDGTVHLSLPLKALSGQEDPQLTLKARIYVKELNNLQGSGACQITLATPMHTDTLNLVLRGASQLNQAVVTASNRISVDGSNASRLNGTFKTPELSVNLREASEVRLNVQAEKSQWELSTASHATLQGTLSSCTLTAQLASSIEAEKCTFGTAITSASGASTILLGETAELSATALSASHISCAGKPRFIKLNSGGFPSISRR